MAAFSVKNGDRVGVVVPSGGGVGARPVDGRTCSVLTSDPFSRGLRNILNHGMMPWQIKVFIVEEVCTLYGSSKQCREWALVPAMTLRDALITCSTVRVLL